MFILGFELVRNSTELLGKYLKKPFLWNNIITKQYIFLSKRVKVVNSHEKFQCRMVSK